MEWGMVGVAAMEGKKWCRNGRGFARHKGVCVVEIMDGRTCEWQLGMIKEGNACGMTTRLIGWWKSENANGNAGNARYPTARLCLCACVADLFVGKACE
ncbi:S ribonuclease [Pyrus ussuriensis x Pyrus communis]|uniref:S ribonuclease n=1 Tax=Pyrus ussuriensis x Pyrus communis TaxID=2448454 RepID=A0A5N5GJ18_9ROSA|nr:S ribonuclease [Pyrus ussuriensis x Pyrus communis]